MNTSAVHGLFGWIGQGRPFRSDDMKHKYYQAIFYYIFKLASIMRTLDYLLYFQAALVSPL